MVRMNIMMPEELAEHLKSVGNKSRYIVEALQEKLLRERSGKLRGLLAEAYTQDAADSMAVERDWAGTSHDGDWVV